MTPAWPWVELSGPADQGDLIRVDDLSVDFPTKEGVVHAVRGVSLTLGRGEALGIVGESGSGKSATALALLGLLPRQAVVRGEATFKGEALLGRSETELMPIRGQGIAMVFQDPMTSLNPVYTVGWQIVEAIRAHQEVSKREAEKIAARLLSTVGIPNPEERLSSYPHEFSGGMRQRVVIAIAMANDPDVILADEPTTALDVTVQAQVLESLRRALTETHASLMLITHDLGVIAGLASRVHVMYAGRLVETGTVDEVFYNAAMPYTRGLLGSLPRLDTDGSERLRPIPGSPPSMIDLPPGCPFAPRCPLRQQICDEEEPPLVPVGGAAPDDQGRTHQAACHFAEDVFAGKAGPIFEATSADIEEVAAV